MVTHKSPNRNLTIVEPFYPVSLFDEIDRFASSIWDSWMPIYVSDFPRLDMYQEKDDLVIKMELPGVDRENINITLEGENLTIKTGKKQEEATKDTTSYLCERRFGQYSRSVSLPFPVDTEKISATFENGLLEIRLPKAEEAKAKQIGIKVK